MRNKSFCFACLFIGTLLRADVALAPFFTDHAVLQQGKPVPVWGTADAGEDVTVVFREDRVTTRADSDGRWQVQLRPHTANAEPAELIVTGHNAIVLKDVVVGEVWLASGQSNMEFKVRLSRDAEKEIAAAHYPLIRHIRIDRKVVDSPLSRSTSKGVWETTTPETVPDFTAVGYYFARELFLKTHIPIGIIHSSWGGTPVEAWMPSKSLARDDAFKVVQERWSKSLADYPKNKEVFDADMTAWAARKAAAESAGKAFDERKPSIPVGPGHPHTPSGLYNGMIHPLEPYALRGVIWYQGEANGSRADEYHALFSAMITGWREAFGQGDFPFYWVQLANYNSGGHADAVRWAFLREAQDQTLSLPNTGEAVAIDLGNATNIHPTNKQEVGRRLALIALARDYGLPVEFSGPRFRAAKIAGSSIRVSLSHAEGLNSGGHAPGAFELAGKDQPFVAAVARIDGDELVVSSPDVPLPVAVRYAWRNNPIANVYNGAGLPMVPFRSDARPGPPAYIP